MGWICVLCENHMTWFERIRIIWWDWIHKKTIKKILSVIVYRRQTPENFHKESMSELRISLAANTSLPSSWSFPSFVIQSECSSNDHSHTDVSTSLKTTTLMGRFCLLQLHSVHTDFIAYECVQQYMIICVWRSGKATNLLWSKFEITNSFQSTLVVFKSQTRSVACTCWQSQIGYRNRHLEKSELNFR